MAGALIDHVAFKTSRRQIRDSFHHRSNFIVVFEFGLYAAYQTSLLTEYTYLPPLRTKSCTCTMKSACLQNAPATLRTPPSFPPRTVRASASTTRFVASALP